MVHVRLRHLLASFILFSLSLSLSLIAYAGVFGQQAPVITWEMNMYGVEEGEGTVEVCATLAPQGNFTVLSVIAATSPVNAGW